jgi:hypothetical protein
MQITIRFISTTKTSWFKISWVTGREITAKGSLVKVTGKLNFSSDIPNFWPVRLFSLKHSLGKYTPKNATIFPV